MIVYYSICIYRGIMEYYGVLWGIVYGSTGGF